jgi:hypothetical protein
MRTDFFATVNRAEDTPKGELRIVVLAELGEVWRRDGQNTTHRASSFCVGAMTTGTVGEVFFLAIAEQAFLLGQACGWQRPYTKE